MIRMLISLAIRLGANAIGLIVAAVVLDGMTLDGVAFVVAVVIFTLVEVFASPLIVQQAHQRANFLSGGTALVATLLGLIITDLVSDGLSISGASTWIAATVIVWLAALLAALLLPVIFVKRRIDDRRDMNPA